MSHRVPLFMEHTMSNSRNVQLLFYDLIAPKLFKFESTQVDLVGPSRLIGGKDHLILLLSLSVPNALHMLSAQQRCVS